MAKKRGRAPRRPTFNEDRNERIELARKKHVEIIPRNVNQERFLALLEDDCVDICFAVGPAGTGKTYIATLYSIYMLKENLIDKIVITRPNVPVDNKDIGFLPGGIMEKMAPWIKPILDIFEEFYSPKQIQYMIEDGVIEICPIAYIRGRTFKNAIVLVDEAQGTTKNSMLSILTRIGDDSRIIVTGDMDQSDRGRDNGLHDFLCRYQESDHIKMICFNHEDVERHPVVKEVLRLYDMD